MNYLAHALPFLDEPYLAAGTAVPDWLSVVDRRVRVTQRRAAALRGDGDPITAAVARGIVQHFYDDARFHGSRAFAELSLELAVRSRGLLEAGSGYQPAFLGHLLVEVLLDAALAEQSAGRLEAYYQALAAVDPQRIERVVAAISSRPPGGLALFVAAYGEQRILWDYLEDGKLMGRLNQVMRRVGFDPMPDEFIGLLPAARDMVAARLAELLEGIPVELPEDGGA